MLVVEGAAAAVVDELVEVVTGATDEELEVEVEDVLDEVGVVELELDVVVLELLVLVELVTGVVDDVDCKAQGQSC